MFIKSSSKGGRIEYGTLLLHEHVYYQSSFITALAEKLQQGQERGKGGSKGFRPIQS